MPTPTTKKFEPKFESQISIESLIAAPLIAASKANVVMITGQTRALLDNCFDRVEVKKPIDPNIPEGPNNPVEPTYIYEPVMINMTLTRSSVEKVKANPNDPNSEDVHTLKAAKLTFAMPLLCLVPINNLVVNEVNVDFDLEITSVTHRETTTTLADNDPIIDKKATLNGKVTNRSGEKGSDETDDTSRLKVNIHASPLPLPKGLLTVLDLYTKSIQPLSTEKAVEHNKPNATT